MVEDTFTFLVGGKAGEGVKKAGSVAAHAFASKGRNIFQMDDYMSLIRGGHNFSVVSSAPRWIASHYMKANLVVCFDKRSYDNHHEHLADGGFLVYNSDEKGDMDGIGVPLTSEAKKYPFRNLMFGVGAVAILVAALGYDKSYLKDLIAQEYPKGTDNNQAYASTIYDEIIPEIGGRFKLKQGNKIRPIIFGNQAIALGAIAGGLDVYYAYPMTPASSILHYLAAHAEEFGLAVIHPENEIAVMNMAVGSSFTGAKTMVGTSGGGFALMVEGFSLAGITEAPVLCVLSTRPGPATGVPTYTEQADLNFALSAGHGEFLRIVASPGTLEEAFYLSAEMLDLVWRFQTPGILLTEKHLSESSMTVDIHPDDIKSVVGIKFQGNGYKRYLDTEDGVSPLLFPPSREVIKWNSYEHDDLGITTEDPYWILKMHDKRNKKVNAIKKYMKEMNTVNITRGEHPSNIITYGSTTMSVFEAINYGQINPTIVQPVYLSPFPVWELEEFKNQDNIVVEQSSTGQFADLLREKAGLQVKEVIKRYDGRPFDPIELSKKIKEVL
jgi:2-oxoglutarate ferredoxin oxidoreductase subunit alpha